VALGDLDNDGDLDVFIANNEADKVLFNDGNGTFTDSGQSLGSSSSLDINLGDLDGDGDLDGITAGIDSRVWLNDGKGNFSSSQIINCCIAITLGDLDNDGDLDAYGGSNGANTIFINDGKGHFTSQYYSNNDTFSIALGDLDNDGDLDALEGNVHGSDDLIQLNTGGGNFVFRSGLSANTVCRAASLNDFDGDGDLDAFLANSGSNKIWINSGVARFIDTGLALGSSYTFDIGIGDLDGDGDLDIFTGNSGANKVWINNTQIKFSTPPQNQVVQGVLYDITLEIAAPAGTNLDVTSHTMPSWINFDATNLSLTGRASAIDIIYDHLVAINVDDGVNTTVLSYNIDVLENTIPQITSTPTTSVQAGTNYQYQVTVTDDSNYDIQAVTIPSWLNFDTESSLLSGTPSSTDVGVHSASIKVTDEIQSVEQNFTIEVTSPPPPPTTQKQSKSSGGGSMFWLLLPVAFLFSIRSKQ